MTTHPSKAFSGSQGGVEWTEEEVARFWSKTESRANGCIEWIKPQADGYGIFNIRGKAWRAHRFSLLLDQGSLDESLYVCHQCDNPSCVNPAHLYEGTATDNARDWSERGIKTKDGGRRKRNSPGQSRKTHCPSGHPYDEKNTYRYKKERHCIACRAEHRAKWLAKRKNQGLEPA